MRSEWIIPNAVITIDTAVNLINLARLEAMIELCENLRPSDSIERDLRKELQLLKTKLSIE